MGREGTVREGKGEGIGRGIREGKGEGIGIVGDGR